MSNTPEYTNPKSHSSAWHWFAWTFAILLIAYPLSIGPALWLMGKNIIPQAAMNAFYFPLDEVVRHCPPADRFFRWYLTLWLPPLLQ